MVVKCVRWRTLYDPCELSDEVRLGT